MVVHHRPSAIGHHRPSAVTGRRPDAIAYLSIGALPFGTPPRRTMYGKGCGVYV
ncbi:hypothetical protein STRIP9103_04974 [Streptomyces ipomoeae 91-03]|uniref:Uncharacterized protein n=1 Tax=Streptomyces ipomoeae 91-03 TaxID=698759 RepID=L1KQV3_9ACTN|nr:hypothetical protein STRIP9103_04974 [Streptomyces ipomoeae 91-03]